ncbi:MAG: alanine/ornithine racemase family PLP-dependent enzyme [Clostridiaceae bacterium]|jgi:predicted amino acid racemase|nr:alanine racemase [Bacillota bacterium]NLN51840.1 alanine/ornithine racemase family PLP-dependent enzyme [Clostridiaceae bacterium]
MLGKGYIRSLPCITIDSKKLKYNLEEIQSLLTEHNLKAHYATQGICAFEPLIKLMAETGVRNFADSRLKNLLKVKPYAESTLLTRVPMISEARGIVNKVDISLNSELETIFALSDAAVVENKTHGVILQVELGDLGAGILPEDLLATVHQILNLRGVKLVGISISLNTFAGVITTLEKIQEFRELIKHVEARFGIELEFVTGGNSGTIGLLDSEEFPLEINHLILSEAWLFGRETSYGHRIGNLHQDIFELSGEIIENQRKPSMPDGEIGTNYKGEKLEFTDHGLIRRIILALGAQDIDFSGIKPQEKGIEYIESTLDYSVFDITKYNRDLEIGDQVDFSLNYSALNRAFTSEYVNKVLI